MFMSRKKKVYSDDFKRKMVMEYEDGDISAPEFAEKHKISVFTFRKWLESSKKIGNFNVQKESFSSGVKPIDVTKEAKEIISKPKSTENKKIDVEINGIVLSFSSKDLRTFLEAIQNG